MAIQTKTCKLAGPVNIGGLEIYKVIQTKNYMTHKPGRFLSEAEARRLERDATVDVTYVEYKGDSPSMSAEIWHDPRYFKTLQQLINEARQRKLMQRTA